MKPPIIAFVAALLTTALPEPAIAQPVTKTAAEFVGHCREITPPEGREEPALILMNGFCLGYVSGLIATNQIFQDLRHSKPLFCAPDLITPSQARLVFLKYMNEHPHQLHQEGGSMVLLSLMAAFPCG